MKMVPFISPLVYLLLLSILAVVRGADLGIHNATDVSTNEERTPRANKRQVKLYSNVRPAPISCRGEGFQEDPVDCSAFHRCIKTGKGKFASFRFQCSPGTIFDPDLKICQHSEKTARIDCGGKNTKSIKHGNENEIFQEIPSPISTKIPTYTEKDPDKISPTLKPHYFQRDQSKNDQWQAKDEQTPATSILPFSQTQSSSTIVSLMTMRPTTARSNFQSGEICTTEGFMGDSENCRKFYRCVGNQRGKFIRYEFLCSDPTIWDEDKQGCNHAWNVKRRRCGRGNDFKNSIKNEVNEYSLNNNETDVTLNKMPKNSQTQTQINFGSQVSQTQSQISNGTVKQNQKQINYANSTETKQNQTQISTGIAVSQSQSQFNYGNKGSQTQIQIDHLNDSSQIQNQISESTTSTTITTTKLSSNNQLHDASSTTKQAHTNNECTESGFVGDQNDCKKFYRCVDNGRGSYTRYEFSCGEGTVWDPSLESCNHAWAVKDCGGKVSSVPSSPATTQSSNLSSATISSTSYSSTLSTSNYYTSAEPTIDEENEIYGNQQIYSTTSKPILVMTTVSTQQGNDNQCRSTGFMGDNNDCKKFYRCVDSGNGHFTRYEFTCGEGTVWDPKIEGCNHAWAVEKCGGNQTNNIDKGESTTTKTSKVTLTPSVSTSQVPQNDEYDPGYGSQQDQPTSSTVITLTTITTTEVTTTTKKTEKPHNQDHNTENVCTSNGFMGDNKDCKKFYRCVDNENGSFTRYEFSCGDGTVWDPKNQVCNHAWAVDKCGGGATNEIETTSQKEFTTTTTVQNSVTDDEDDVGYGQQNNVTPSSSTSTETHPENGNTNLCRSSGFIGDNNDCKKFYRCVDNDNGGFTRYDFTCGEGTVWDPKIEACNHAWAVEKCGGSGIEKQPEASSQSSPISNDQENQSEKPIQNEEYTDKPEESTLSSASTSLSSTVMPSEICKKSGFMGDSQDCSKFYRCVENGQGGFIQYEFTCGEGTVWDSSIESCNHYWAVADCNRSDNHNTTNSAETISTEGTVKPEDQGNTNQQPNEGSSTSTSSTGMPSVSVCKHEGFYGDENNCKHFYRCVDNGQGGYTKYEFTCGEGTVWNQDIQACDHETSNNSCKTHITTSSTKKPESQNDEYTEGTTEHLPTTSLTEHYNQSGVTPSSDDKCESEGFFGDSKNCKKFYRCVDNGKGTYTKYEFTCGEGTVWVQEIQACDHDNGIISCTGEDSTKPTPFTNQTESTQSTQNNTSSTTQSSTTQSHTTESSTSESSTTQSSSTQSSSQLPDKESGENTADSSTKPSTGKCTSEGFYANEDDCTKFYRCVDSGQGSYTKYDFACGSGTAWDSDIQTCNHIHEVSSCNKSNQEEIMHDEELSQPSTEFTSTTKSSISTESSNSNNDVCKQEGFYGNTKDCTKFYRCVDNGKGYYTKYDFDCGEGTIWDQDLTTCNHPQDVVNPSCDKNNLDSSSTDNSTSSSGSQPISNSDDQNSTQENSTKKPDNQNIKCEKEGFYANPNDCKKFYRCVDWDGNGERFSVFHFECGEGTIWDPQLDTCNHEDSVYPPRNCNGTQSQSENTTQANSTTENTTTQSTTSSTSEITSTTSTTTQQSSSSEQTTQQSSTTQLSTTQSTTTTSEATTEQSNKEPSTTTQDTSQDTSTDPTTQSSDNTSAITSSEITTTEGATTSEQTTTQQSTTGESISEQPTTSESTTTQQTTTSEQTPTQQPTTEQVTTDKTTDYENSTTEFTTTEQATTEQSASTTQKIEELTTEQQTTENQSTTTESSTESNAQSTTETTDNDSSSTTESDQGTTTEESTHKDCPDTEDDQYLYVCPTSFRRHPKYCNMFYQCTEDDDSHETKIATFTCPNNTIYDENKVQCVEEDKADKKCDGQIARKHRVKRLNYFSMEPMQVDRDPHKCSKAGYYPFEKNNECSTVFLKCSLAKSGKTRGYVYQCPEGYVFWSISKKCEKRESMKYCQESSRKNWINRWEIPVERRNIAK